MELIYATNKLLDRAKNRDASVHDVGFGVEDEIFSSWYATYAIIEKQHVAVPLDACAGESGDQTVKTLSGR